MAEQVSSLKTGIKYKNTPIGKIPVDWEVGRLGDLCIGEAEYGANVPSMEKHNNLPRYVRITDITDSGKLLESTSQSINKESAQPYILVEGDFLFARSGATVGKSYLYRKKDGECAFAGYLIRFKPDSNQLLPEFLFYFTHSDYYYNWVKGILRAGAQPNINAKEYSNMLLPKPPIWEQKGIVEILTTLDEVIEKADQIIEKTKETKKGLMQKLLTRGIGHKNFRKTEIGEIPIEWEAVRVKDISQNFYNGGTPDTNIKDYWDGNIPWITGADFEDQKIKRIRRYITNEGAKNSATNVIQKGNLLVVTRTGVGKLAIAPFDIAISQDITGVILDSEKALVGYVYWYLNYKSNRLKSIIQGTSINGLLREDLESFMIPLPRVDEQKQIAGILSSVDEEIEKETRHKEQLESLKKGLMQVLLTGKIRIS